jgi:hypothetical protein
MARMNLNEKKPTIPPSNSALGSKAASVKLGKGSGIGGIGGGGL